jgi:cellulose synthase/poly-beta-1,6-N-acetylglucosamine synthase-like glycosyltransferase
VLPCFNESANISKSIERCYFQDYVGEIEIIIVDDGSLDETFDIGKIHEWAYTNREVKVYHKENEGKAKALDFGTRKCTGHIIIHTDGDSYFEKDVVTKIVDAFKKYPNAGIVGGFVAVGNDEIPFTKVQQIEYLYFQYLQRYLQSSTGSVLIIPGPIFGIGAAIAKKHPSPTRTCAEDADLTVTILSEGWETRCDRSAIVRTEAPTKFKNWWKQRKRWIYGMYQVWRYNRKYLKNNCWGILFYTQWWFSLLGLILFTTLISIIPIFVPVQSLFAFVGVKMLIIILLYFITRILILRIYKQVSRFVKYSFHILAYDMILGLLRGYLFLRYLMGIGTKIKFGPRYVTVK